MPGWQEILREKRKAALRDGMAAPRGLREFRRIGPDELISQFAMHLVGIALGHQPFFKPPQAMRGIVARAQLIKIPESAQIGGNGVKGIWGVKRAVLQKHMQMPALKRRKRGTIGAIGHHLHAPADAFGMVCQGVEQTKAATAQRGDQLVAGVKDQRRRQAVQPGPAQPIRRAGLPHQRKRTMAPGLHPTRARVPMSSTGRPGTFRIDRRMAVCAPSSFTS